MTVLMDLLDDLRGAQEEILYRARGQRVGPVNEGTAGNGSWVPMLDLAENKDAYLVTVELPGVGIDDLNITCLDGLMTIQGERHDTNDSSEQTVHRAECRYGPFLRSITLPGHVAPDTIKATTQDGVLQVVVPKPKDARAEHIQVHAGRVNAVRTPSSLGK
jgi:HSP20 family protein